MASTRTIEDFAEEIVGYITDVDFDNMTNMCDTLEKMKFSTKSKHNINYWRVMQCLGEISSDRIMTFLIKIEKNSCKCHLSKNFCCFMKLFNDSLCNQKVIKRMLEFQHKLVPMILKGIRQPDEPRLTMLSFEAVMKFIIIGQAESVKLFAKYGLINDIFFQIKRMLDTDNFSFNGINIVLRCSEVCFVTSLFGTDSVKRQVYNSGSPRVLCQYIMKIKAKDDFEKMAKDNLSKSLTVIKSVLTDESSVLKLTKDWNPKAQLMAHLSQAQMFVFCSAPSCRKVHDECGKFRYCGACRLARYCSEACQKEHWKKGHKDACQHGVSLVGL